VRNLDWRHQSRRCLSAAAQYALVASVAGGAANGCWLIRSSIVVQVLVADSAMQKILRIDAVF